MDVVEKVSRSLLKAEGYLQLGLSEAALPIVVPVLTSFPEAFRRACFFYGWAKHLSGDLTVSRYALEQVLEAASLGSGSSIEFVKEYPSLVYGCVDWAPNRCVPNCELIGLFPVACMRAIQGKKEEALALLAERPVRH